LPFRKKDGGRKSKGTIETYLYHINNLILPRWKDHIAAEMKPIEILNRTKTKASKAPVPMCEALAATLDQWRHETPHSQDEDFVFASPTLNGKQPLWGQTMNAHFVKLTAVALGLVAEGQRFGWHRFRHSLSTWANETTKDITVSQTMLRHAKPDTTAIYTHGNLGKALDAQRVYMEQLQGMKPACESLQ